MKSEERDDNVKLPYIMFYPGDWLKDMELQSCTHQTKGIWMDMLCHMWQSEICGYLWINGRPMDERKIQKLLRLDDESFNEAWQELRENGVIKYDSETGAYFSRRLVKDYDSFLQKMKRKRVTPAKMKSIENTILYLNQKAEYKFDANNPGNMRVIENQLNAGYAEKDFKDVIDLCCENWINDSYMSQFLRPSTLFGEKFESYVQAAQKKTKEKIPVPSINPYKNMLR